MARKSETWCVVATQPGKEPQVVGAFQTSVGADGWIQLHCDTKWTLTAVPVRTHLKMALPLGSHRRKAVRLKPQRRPRKLFGLRRG